MWLNISSVEGNRDNYRRRGRGRERRKKRSRIEVRRIGERENKKSRRKLEE